MRIKLKMLALVAAAGLMLAACSQQKAEQAPQVSAPEAAAPAEELPPADLSATAPEGQSAPTKFAGEAPAEQTIDVIPSPAPPPIAALPEPPPIAALPEPSPPPPSAMDRDVEEDATGAPRERAQAEEQARGDESASIEVGEFEKADRAGPDLSSSNRSVSGGSGGYAAAAPKKAAPPIAAAKPRATIAPGAVRSAPPPTSSQVVMSKKADGTTKVTVYFATDRKIEVKNNVRRFGSDEVNGLYYGTVDVTIPPLHQVGAVESPEWWKMEFTADPEKHVVFQGFNLLKRDNFYAALSSLIQQSKDKEAFVFVHGFNTPFEDAARRTAQIEYDLKFDGAPIFYSWPSQGELSPLAYNRDATMSDRTVPRLKFFLKEVAQRTGAKRIHLIAHSMGNKAMVNALARVADEMTTGQAPLFNQIVLTAPDIDREVFMDIAQRIRKTGSAVTLYASKNDKALQASKLYSGFSRAGDAAPAPVIVPGIYTVDASAVTTDYFGLNHDFFASQRTVLSDLTKLLVTGATPDGRKLRKKTAADGSFYWVID